MSDSEQVPYVLLVGIDIAARSARVRWITAAGEISDGLTIAQTPEGHQELRQKLLDAWPRPEDIHVTLEATGSFYVHLAHFLHEQGFAVSVVNALRVRRFAESYLQLDKNDDLDALTLARFGAMIRPQRWLPPTGIYEDIFQLITQRRTLVVMHANMDNRQKALDLRIRQRETVKTRMSELEKLLKRQRDAIDRELVRVLAQDAQWQASFQHIISIPGIGISTAAWLIMLTRNFTACSSPKELAAYIGLVPRQRQSGESLDTFRSVGHVGHDDIRQQLYRATISSLYLNPVIRDYYDRVKKRRGKHKIACIAASRKLLNIIWAVAKNGTTFDPDYKRRLPDDPGQSAKQGGNDEQTT